MSARNAHFYSRNEGRLYPLDEAADGIDTRGGYLPPNVLTDLNLRYPVAYGRYPFLAAATVTPTVVTLAFQACDSLDPPYAFNPLAVLTVLRPADEGRQLALSPLLPGVGGWAVLGSGARDRDYTGRLAGPRRGLLTRRAARPYAGIPVEGLKRLHAAKTLSGVVRLRGDPPVQIAAEDRDIPGVGTRRVVVFRLAGLDATDGFVQPEETVKASNVFREFAGPCVGRPESRTCGDPQPIEFVNNVGPDCDGVLTIRFKGCAIPAPIVASGYSGAVIDASTPVTAVCFPPAIPAADGKLPSEYDPATYTTPEPTTTEAPPEPPPEESIDILGELPYTECFDAATAADFVVTAGAFQFAADYSPDGGDFCAADSLDSGDAAFSYESANPGTRNVSVWAGFDLTTVRRRYVADVKMLPGGSRSNAALVLNFKPHPSTAGLFVYHTVEIDFDAQAFRVARFNGVSFQTILQQSVPGIRRGVWYRLVAEVRPGPTGGTTQITASAVGLSDPVTVTVGPLVVSSYYPSTGTSGVGTNLALSRFAFFRVEELL